MRWTMINCCSGSNLDNVQYKYSVINNLSIIIPFSTAVETMLTELQVSNSLFSTREKLQVTSLVQFQELKSTTLNGTMG